MPELLIIADDLTGALDTGVQLVKRGLPVRILLYPAAGDPSEDGGYAAWDEPGFSVLVLVAETRHSTPAEAYRVVSTVLRKARAMAIPVIYKKTDSALRGNIGSELQAMLDVYPGEPVCFVPAFPAAGRTTQGGVQYIDGQPAADSPFGRDPLSPVRESYIPAWLRQKGLTGRCRPVGKGAFPLSSATDPLPTAGNMCVAGETNADGETRMPGDLFVFDAQTDEDLREIVSMLRVAVVPEGRPRLLAGCAGFAQMLPLFPALRGRERETAPDASLETASTPDASDSLILPGMALLVLSGSQNEITMGQIAFAADRGFVCREIGEEILLAAEPEIADIPSMADVVLYPAAEVFLHLPPLRQSAGPDPRGLAQRMGMLGKQLRDRFPDRLMMVVGGDTLAAVLRNIGISSLFPLAEIGPGTVLARGTPGDFLFIGKSGGLGDSDVFVRVRDFIRHDGQQAKIRAGTYVGPNTANIGNTKHTGGKHHGQ